MLFFSKKLYNVLFESIKGESNVIISVQDATWTKVTGFIADELSLLIESSESQSILDKINSVTDGTFIYSMNSRKFIPSVKTLRVDIKKGNIQVVFSLYPYIETKVETPVETKVETPVETPVETKVETKVETPVETPVETKVETPVETPVETKVEGSVEEPIAKEKKKAGRKKDSKKIEKE